MWRGGHAGAEADNGDREEWEAWHRVGWRGWGCWARSGKATVREFFAGKPRHSSPRISRICTRRAAGCRNASRVAGGVSDKLALAFPGRLLFTLISVLFLPHHQPTCTTPFAPFVKFAVKQFMAN